MKTYDRDWEEYPVNYDDGIQKLKAKNKRGNIFIMKRSFFMIVFGTSVWLIVSWWPHILRMLNGFLQ